jgi:hypothetical protein
MTLMENGAAIESATIGREGALGLMAAVAPRQSLSRAIVQAPGVRLADQRHGPARGLDSAARPCAISSTGTARPCSAMRPVGGLQRPAFGVEARFCRWLLTCRDRIDDDTVGLTQEFLADMLGVQRTTVTAVAGSLQAKGLIRYRRGVVDILDRQGLEAMTCECYGRRAALYERLLPLPFG